MEQQILYLKQICELLGIDTADYGLTNCDLANSYLQRIILFLGG